MRKLVIIIVTIVAGTGGLLATNGHLGGEPFRSKSIDVFFSPGGGAEEGIVSELREAKKTIVVAIYTFTDQTLADTLAQRAMNGVEVRVLFDEDEAKFKWSKARDLSKSDSRVVTRRYKPEPSGAEAEDSSDRPRMHHKFCVIDGKVVVTGSFNWTGAADNRNNENVIVLRDKRVAAAFEAEFDALWELAKE